jgi:hypothetical protein
MSILFYLSIQVAYVISQQVKKCPNYTCAKGTENSCANVKSYISTIGYNYVNLTDTCKPGEICNVGSSPYAILSDIQRDEAFTCDIRQILRYPGEDCKHDSDCYKDEDYKTTGTCVNNKCTGQGVDDPCDSHKQCLKGLYCNNKPSGICKPQLGKDEPCTTTYGCINSLLCHGNKCQLKPFSIDIGTVVGKQDDSFLKCRFVLIDCDGICTSHNQTEEYKDYLTCKHGDACTYSLNGGDTKYVNCPCGYNAEGLGYCPIGHNKSKLSS